MKILDEIKESVLALEKDLEVYLFGSRARKEEHKDSDWDILILIPDGFDFNRKRRISEILYDLEIKYSTLFNIIYQSKTKWNNEENIQVTPFYQSVSKEYIKL